MGARSGYPDRSYRIDWDSAGGGLAVTTILCARGQGLPLPAAAAALGIPGGTAKSRYHHAMSALRAALEAEERRVGPGTKVMA